MVLNKLKIWKIIFCLKNNYICKYLVEMSSLYSQRLFFLKLQQKTKPVFRHFIRFFFNYILFALPNYFEK